MGRKCKGTVKGEKCVFGPGGKHASPKPGNDRCSWCCPQLLRQVVGTAGGQSKLRQHYSKFTEAIALKALGRLPENAKAYFDADSIDKLRTASQDTATAARRRREQDYRDIVADIAADAPDFAAGARAVGALPPEESGEGAPKPSAAASSTPSAAAKRPRKKK